MPVPERSDSAAHGISPELSAAITEKVKKELMEHLKQTGTPVDSQKQHCCNAIIHRRDHDQHRLPPQLLEKSPSPVQHTKPAYPPAPAVESYPSEPLKPQPPSPVEKPSNVRFSDQPQPQSRPAGGPRTFSSLELSTIDQKWGRLFDSNGDPTQRLGQFLRGLANHIIAEFNPKRSIVVTPVKMATYYSTYALEPEVQHYASIFKAQSNEQISRLYQDLGCEHHLVQDATFVPIVPALTPVGFARWMSLHIMAYPDQEAKRLEKAVLDLPIDADGLTEGKAERLPKQISRHLLPEKEDRDPKMLIETVVANFFEDLGSTKRREASNIASPTLSRHSPIAAVRTTNTRQQRPVEIHQATASPPQSKQIERERKPYSGAPSVPSNVSTSSNEDGSVKTERERQPYTAQPSCCKVYTDGRSLNSGPRLGRTNSTSQRRETPDDRLPSENRTQCNARQTYARGQSFSEREKYRGAPAEDWYREPPKGRGYEENRY